MTSSRLSRVADAVRPTMKARLMLAGPAGAGKTHTALTIATALAEGGKPLLIDTEEESALTYADKFDFLHLPWEPPYDPQELAEVVSEAARQHPVVIIDSASHFWMDDGGTLDIAGGKFTGWKTARPKQRDFIVSVLRAPTHMIVCVRSKMEHAQELDPKTNKQVVTKLGLAPIQDSTFEYEMNVSAEIDMTHRLAIGKTRCDILDGREFPAGHAADMAQVYGEWLKGGEPVADAATVSDLVSRMNAIADEDRRKEAKREFVSRFGRPEHLAATKVVSAQEFVAAYEVGGDGSADERGDDTPPDSSESDPPARSLVTQAAPAPQLAVDPNPMTDKQKGRLFALLSEAGVTDRDARHGLAAAVLGHPVETFTELSVDDAAALIDHLKTAGASA